MEDVLNDQSTATTPSAPSGSSPTVAPAAEANVENESVKQNDALRELDDDPNDEVKSGQSLAKTKSKVRNAFSSTPLRTRSGLTRLPPKRSRPVDKPTKKKSTTNEPHTALQAQSTSTVSSLPPTNLAPSSQLPVDNVAPTGNIVNQMSALSIQAPDSGSNAPGQTGIIPSQISFIPKATSCSAFDLQQQTSAKNNRLQDNQQHVRNVSTTCAFQFGCSQINTNGLFTNCS